MALLGLVKESGEALRIRDVERDGERLVAELAGDRLGGVDAHVADGLRAPAAKCRAIARPIPRPPGG